VKPTERVYVAGHRGLVGSALVRRLQGAGYCQLILRSRHELDLTDRKAVDEFFEAQRPQYVFLAAARVGGIIANSEYPADFLRENLDIARNVLDAAYRNQVKKLLFLGSSCIYPKLAPQPMREADLLTGALEPTNRAYAIAKLAGLEMCRAYRAQYNAPFIAALPTNLYGPNDNFDLQSSHVLAALIRKITEAAESNLPEVTVWGTGEPRREFLHVDDLADACQFLMQVYDDAEPINVGTGKDISILELAQLVADLAGFKGRIVLDPSKPDGAPRKLLDVSRLSRLGWTHQIGLREGIRRTIEWYRAIAVSAATV
jgi:GDP-L-fucose synthase